MIYNFKKDDAYNFARHIGAKTKKHGDQLKFKECPYCHGRGSGNEDTFAISLKTGQFNCLRASCGVTGNMIRLSRDFDFSLGRDIDAYYRPQKKFKPVLKKKEPILPKSAAVKYLESRGISQQIAEKYEITTQTNKDNILVFPFRDEEGVMWFAKYRKTDYDKTKDNNKEWCEKNCKPILFGMYQCNLENKTLIITEGQCFDGSAEVLTPNGWKRLECYGGEDVLQVDDNMCGSFVRPKQFIVKRHIGKMIKVEIGGNYETYTTDDHNLVFTNKRNEVIKRQAGEKISTAYHIPTAITIDGAGCREWSNDMFALYIAISADGTIDHRKNTGWKMAKSPRYVRIAIALERKHKRLCEILKALGIEYSDNADSRGYRSVCFPCPEWLTSKYLPYEFATQTTVEQKKFILDEMVKWDGNKVNGRNQYEYTTILKHNADVMQLIASSSGYMSTIMTKQNGGNGEYKKSYCYKVSILFGKHNVSTQQFEKSKQVIDVDQRVYCVTVDTGMILVRQNNRISVSGNCDSLSVAEAGIENAVSVPTGAKGFTWVPYCWDWVNQFEEIIVFGDYEKGHITLLDEISKRFRLCVKHVREEDYKDCKDANEILLKYGRGQIKYCVENAVAIPTKNVIDLSDVETVDVFELEKLKTGIKQLDNLLYGGLPFGGVTLITGKSGKGKSTLASQILAQAIYQGHICFAYSGELPNYLFRAWLDFQIAGRSHVIDGLNSWGDRRLVVSKTNRELIANWYKGKCFIYDSSLIEDDEKEDLIDAVENTILRQGARVILIDNLMTALDLDSSAAYDKYDKQSNFVKRLTRIALRYDALILLVAHKRKNNFGTNENDEVAGSSDITNLGMITLSYDTDRNIDPDQRLLKVSKNRLFGKVETDGFILDYDEKSKRITGSGDDLDYDFGWCPDGNEEKKKSDSTEDGFTKIDGDIPFKL